MFGLALLRHGSHGLRFFATGTDVDWRMSVSIDSVAVSSSASVTSRTISVVPMLVGSTNERTPNANGLTDALCVSKARVNLLLIWTRRCQRPLHGKVSYVCYAYHEIESDEQSRFMNCFADKMTLPE